MRTKQGFWPRSMAAVAAGVVMAAIPVYAGTECTPEWSSISENTSTDNTVYDITTTPSGDLLVCGLFTQIEGVAANGIARWNGNEWHALGSGLDSNFYQPQGLRVLALSDGDVVVVGDFSSVGGVSGTKGLARWDGTSWSTIGGGTDGRVEDLAVLSNGDLIIGGTFTTAGGVSVSNIARWNGSSWSAIGSGTVGTVNVLKVLSNGDLIVGGGFTSAGGVSGTSRVARWNTGDGWSAIGTGGITNGAAYCIGEISNGDLIVAGNFTSASGVAASRIARWNGAAWFALGTGVNQAVRTLEVLPSDEILVGGGFTSADGNTANRLARWDGAAWSALGGTGLDSTCWTLVSDGNGSLLAGGVFTMANSVSAPFIARWGCPPAPACAADFNDVNGVTVQDIFDFLTAWLAGSASADFNAVNGVTVQDIFDFLTAWLAGC